MLPNPLDKSSYLKFEAFITAQGQHVTGKFTEKAYHRHQSRSCFNAENATHADQLKIKEQKLGMEIEEFK